jgi:hypothetical protein
MRHFRKGPAESERGQYQILARRWSVIAAAVEPSGSQRVPRWGMLGGFDGGAECQSCGIGVRSAASAPKCGRSGRRQPGGRRRVIRDRPLPGLRGRSPGRSEERPRSRPGRLIRRPPRPPPSSGSGLLPHFLAPPLRRRVHYVHIRNCRQAAVRYHRIMSTFLYRCPATGYRVQGFIADAPSTAAASSHVYEPVTCTACRGIHLINPHNGKVLGEGTKKP